MGGSQIDTLAFYAPASCFNVELDAVNWLAGVVGLRIFLLISVLKLSYPTPDSSFPQTLRMATVASRTYLHRGYSLLLMSCGVCCACSYLFDDFQMRTPGTRRPPCDSLLDGARWARNRAVDGASS
eukprot:5478255-Pleurochrysis_carterae.AAC.1